MKYKLKKSRINILTVVRLINLLLIFLLFYSTLKLSTSSDNIYLKISFIFFLVFAIRKIIKLRKLRQINSLEIKEKNLTYYKFKKVFQKTEIESIKFVYGTFDSFILIFPKINDLIKWWNLKQVYSFYYFGTKYRINTEEIDGSDKEIYETINNWLNSKTEYNTIDKNRPF